jgi:hypothetical protein
MLQQIQDQVAVVAVVMLEAELYLMVVTVVQEL